VQYAGISSPGLYQINVTVPSLLAGDAAVLITVNGMQSAAQVFIPVGTAASPGVLNETTINFTVTIGYCYTVPPPFTATASFTVNLPQSLAPENVNSGTLEATQRVTIPAIPQFACVTAGLPIIVAVSATYNPGFQTANFLLTLNVDTATGTINSLNPVDEFFVGGASGVTPAATQLQLQPYPATAGAGAVVW
jgi:hypothetical protein